jgi:hypothetical protein
LAVFYLFLTVLGMQNKSKKFAKTKPKRKETL